MLFPLLVLISSLFIIGKTSSESTSPKDFPDVLQEYNKFPFPPVNMEEESLDEPPLSRGPSLGEINHFIHRGRLVKDRPYRLWIVGGGSGNSTLHYAHEFRHFNVEIVYMDISKVSLEMARQRAEKRNYKIQYVHNSIYNSPELNLGKFDFIDCVEVFHQLSDQGLALQILKDSLKDESSGLYLSLHGTEGRKGTNLMRKLINLVNEDQTNLSMEEELDVGIKLYQSLPKLHWIYFPYIEKTPLVDNSTFYHKYINKHDHSFSVNEVYEFIEKNGSLALVDFADPDARIFLSQGPRNDPEFTELMSELTISQRNDILERIYSALSEINIFVSKDPKASVDYMESLDYVPYFYNIDPSPIINHLSIQECSIEGMKKFINVSMALNIGNWRDFFHPVTANTLTFYELITVRKYTIEDILQKTADINSIEDKVALKEDLMSLLKVLQRHGMIVFRHASTPDESSFSRQPSGVIEAVRIINFELPIYASEWPRWIPTDGKQWPKMVK